MADEIDFTKIRCPDCKEPKLNEGGYDSDEIDDGYTIVCEGCGFSIAGQNERVVRDAILVLHRWNGAA